MTPTITSRVLISFLVLSLLVGCSPGTGNLPEIPPSPTAAVAAPAATPDAETLKSQVVNLVAGLSRVESLRWRTQTDTHVDFTFTQGGMVREAWTQDGLTIEQGVASGEAGSTLKQTIEFQDQQRNSDTVADYKVDAEVRRVNDRTYLKVGLDAQPDQALDVPEGWIEVLSDLTLDYWPGLAAFSMPDVVTRAAAAPDVQVMGRDGEAFRRIMTTALIDVTPLVESRGIHLELGPYALVTFAKDIDFTQAVPGAILAQASGPTVIFDFHLDESGRLSSWERRIELRADDLALDLDPARADEGSVSVWYRSETSAQIDYESLIEAVQAPDLQTESPAFSDRMPGGGIPFATLIDFDRAAGAVVDLASADAFWTRVTEAQEMPLVFGDVALFLYRGPANSVRWSGDWLGWEPGPGARLGGTDIWYAVATFPPDARIEYKLIIDEQPTWFVDPLNPEQWLSSLGPNSVLMMPEYKPSPWVGARPDVPAGDLSDDRTLSSEALGYDQHYRVYVPAGYTFSSAYPVLYVLDGQDYLEYARMQTILDNLIGEHAIAPLIAVFIDPRDPRTGRNLREDQFLGNPAFQAYLLDELIPAVDQAYASIPVKEARALMGSSYGGFLTAAMTLKGRDQIGIFGILSPSLWVDLSLIDRIGTEASPVKIFLHTGRFADNLAESRALQPVLEEAGFDYRYLETNEGHSYANWQGILDDMLIYFFPPAG